MPYHSSVASELGVELIHDPAMLKCRGSNPQKTMLTWYRRAAAMLGRILHLTMYWTRGFAAAGALARMSSLMLSQPCKISALSTRRLQPIGFLWGGIHQEEHRHLALCLTGSGQAVLTHLLRS